MDFTFDAFSYTPCINSKLQPYTIRYFYIVEVAIWRLSDVYYLITGGYGKVSRV